MSIWYPEINQLQRKTIQFLENLDRICKKPLAIEVFNSHPVHLDRRTILL